VLRLLFDSVAFSLAAVAFLLQEIAMMWTRKIILISFAGLATCGYAQVDSVVWNLDNLTVIDGHKVIVEGDPKVIETQSGSAIEFDGTDDGIFLDVHPLEGMSTFTVEVIFKPYADGPSEQRFFHMQEDPTDSRVMFETRLVKNEFWFLDTFIKSGEQGVTHYASEHEHPIGPWYHAAIVVDENSFNHYVDGALELSAEIQFNAQQTGETSLGVRLNKVHWFKGAIRTIRITPRALSPEEFLSKD